jgi:hypothetical protein
MTQVASAAPDPTPAEIVVPTGNSVFLVGHATGVQIYACNGSTWGPTSTPDATLVDDNGKVVARHFAVTGPDGQVRPAWEATDGSGSRVVGALPPQAKVTVDPSAIPWLRLGKFSTTPGLFEKTTFIQRVNTTGGLPPKDPCTTGDPAKRIPYTANYRFWKPVGA